MFLNLDVHHSTNNINFFFKRVIFDLIFLESSIKVVAQRLEAITRKVG